ncbi:MAG: hypothetical protein JWP63_2717 [Candidatus Solibacter sp.]|nr:hypothetical protein [Candidatus Solibacter sp.]
MGSTGALSDQEGRRWGTVYPSLRASTSATRAVSLSVVTWHLLWGPSDPRAQLARHGPLATRRFPLGARHLPRAAASIGRFSCSTEFFMAPFGATTRDENTRSFFWERHLQGSELMRWGRQIRAATVRERWSRDHRSVTVAALIGVVLQRSFPWDPSGPQQGMKFDDRFLERHFQGSVTMRQCRE